MSRAFLFIFSFLLMIVVGAEAQISSNTDYQECDSVARKVTVYYASGQNRTIDKSQYKSLNEFIDWAKKNPLMPIHIIGWADKTGTAFQNARVSLFRARTVRNYLVRKGVEAARISYRGAGVDSLALSNRKARRADVCGRVVLELIPSGDLSEENKSIKDNPDDIPQSNVISNEELPIAQQNLNNWGEREEKVKYVSQTRSLESTRFYAGVGTGLSFAKSTLRSLATYGNHAGYTLSLLGGYRIDKIWAVELFMKYTRLKMYADKCCADYYIGVDGNTYTSPDNGITSYPYKNIKSDSRVFCVGGHLNINLVPLWNPFSRWSALVMPFINGVYNRANIVYKNDNLFTKKNYHFALGLDIGGEYQLNDFIALRLATGMNFITGKSIDGLVKGKHKTNYIWNTLAHIIFNY